MSIAPAVYYQGPSLIDYNDNLFIVVEYVLPWPDLMVFYTGLEPRNPTCVDVAKHPRLLRVFSSGADSG